MKFYSETFSQKFSFMTSKMMKNKIKKKNCKMCQNWFGAKHSPLSLGVWVTQGRILEVQCKYVQLSFVRLCSQKILHFHDNPAPEPETTRNKLQNGGVLASRLWNFTQELFHKSFFYDVKNYEKKHKFWIFYKMSQNWFLSYLWVSFLNFECKKASVCSIWWYILMTIWKVYILYHVKNDEKMKKFKILWNGSKLIFMISVSVFFNSHCNIASVCNI